jgi:hypothetical protein
MLRVTDGAGVRVALELWDVPPAGLVSILEREPPGLSIGSVALEDGRSVLGVLGERYLTEGQADISAHGGWRAYRAAAAAAAAAAAPAEEEARVERAAPYPFAFPRGARTALVMVDFQRDFVAPGGFGAALGNDVALLRGARPASKTCHSAVVPLSACAACARAY